MTSRETPVDATPPKARDESRELDAIDATSSRLRHRADITPSTRRRPDDAIEQTRRRHRTRRGKRTLNAVLSVAFSGQSTQISTGSRNAGRISRSTHGSAGGWSAGAASPRNADSRSSAIVLATVLRRAASIFVWTIASIFRVVVRAAMRRAACTARVFCVCLRATGLVLQPASRGVAAGCVVWVFASFK